MTGPPPLRQLTDRAVVRVGEVPAIRSHLEHAMHLEFGDRVLRQIAAASLENTASSLLARSQSTAASSGTRTRGAEAMLDAIRLGHEGVLCVTIGRGLALLRLKGRTRRASHAIVLRHVSASGKQ